MICSLYRIDAPKRLIVIYIVTHFETMFDQAELRMSLVWRVRHKIIDDEAICSMYSSSV